MKMTLEAKLLNVQITKVDRNVYAKCFIANDPDTENEALASIVSMNIVEENADSVFAYVNTQGIQFGDKVRLYIKPVRGAQNTVRNVVERIEAIQAPAKQAHVQQTTSAKA